MATGPPVSMKPLWSARRRPQPSSWLPQWRTTSRRSGPMWRRSASAPMGGQNLAICAKASGMQALPSGTESPPPHRRSRSGFDMYVYDEFDRTLVAERVAEFRDQVARRISGELTEEEFKPLRLMNGVYLQLHAYMLRIAIPYGSLSSDQLRTLALVTRRYDRNYGHFTTRQNLQLNWIKLSDLPDLMADLARAGLHGMQTSGNCVRNITT